MYELLFDEDHLALFDYALAADLLEPALGILIGDFILGKILLPFT